jgi:hypothetical protein
MFMGSAGGCSSFIYLMKLQESLVNLQHRDTVFILGAYWHCYQISKDEENSAQNGARALVPICFQQPSVDIYEESPKPIFNALIAVYFKPQARGWGRGAPSLCRPEFNGPFDKELSIVSRRA